MTITPLTVADPIPVYQGATFLQRFLLTNTSDGSPYDLTGKTAALQARVKTTDTTPFIDLNVGNGGIVMGGTAGYIDAYLTPTQTANLPAPLAGVWDMKVTGSTVDRFFQGTITVSPAVTR